MANTTNFFSAYIKQWLKNFKISIKTLKDKKKSLSMSKIHYSSSLKTSLLIKESPASLPSSWRGGNIGQWQGAAHGLLDSIPVYYSSLSVRLTGWGHNGFSFILFAHDQPTGVHLALSQQVALEACTNLPSPNYKSVESSFTTIASTESLKYVRCTVSREF